MRLCSRALEAMPDTMGHMATASRNVIPALQGMAVPKSRCPLLLLEELVGNAQLELILNVHLEGHQPGQ